MTVRDTVDIRERVEVSGTEIWGNVRSQTQARDLHARSASWCLVTLFVAFEGCTPLGPNVAPAVDPDAGSDVELEPTAGGGGTGTTGTTQTGVSAMVGSSTPGPGTSAGGGASAAGAAGTSAASAAGNGGGASGAPVEPSASGQCMEGEASCSGPTPRQCVAGRWMDGAPCAFVCTNGSCTGECKPNSLQCRERFTHTCSLPGVGKTAPSARTCARTARVPARACLKQSNAAATPHKRVTRQGAGA